MHGEVHELRGRIGGSPRPRVSGRGIEDRRDVSVRIGRRQRQVPRPFLQIGESLREPSMERASFVRGGARVHGRPEERVREAQPAVDRFDDTRCLRGSDALEGAFRPIARDTNQIQGGVRRRRDHQQGIARGWRKALDAGREQLAEIVGHGELISEVGTIARPDDLAGGLQSEQRTPLRDRVDAEDDRPTQVEAHPLAQQPTQPLLRERADPEALDPVEAERPLDIDPFRRYTRSEPERREHADRLVLQPSEHEGQHAGGRRIEPLHVVDRDHDGRVLRERSDDTQRGE